MCQGFYEQENETESFGFSPFGCFCRIPRCCKRREPVGTINIINDVEIKQEASANGGDGGNYNNANGGAASAAAAGLVAVAGALQAAKNEAENEEEYDPLQNAADEAEKGSRPSNDGNTAEAEGGDADSGNGGDGGTAVNVAGVGISNIVIIPGKGRSPYSAYRLNVNDNSFDISTDEQGNTLVNGQKMDEQPLADGSRVFIFKSVNA